MWTGSGRIDGKNFLFSDDKEKRKGDLIILLVKGELKDKITMELKRLFPPPITKTPKKDKNGKPIKPKKSSPSSPSQVYDKITTIIVDELNTEHLVVKGRKDVLFNNRKRAIEIQALIARRDIDGENTLQSDKIIEQNITGQR